jgi:hypothetical protein
VQAQVVIHLLAAGAVVATMSFISHSNKDFLVISNPVRPIRAVAVVAVLTLSKAKRREILGQAVRVL